MFLDFLGNGLFRRLSEDFPELMYDGGLVSLKELEAGVLTEPDIANRHRDLGRRLLQDAKPVPARTALMKALQLDSGDSLARLGLACALESMGMPQTAMDELHLCLKHRPDFQPALVALDYCSRRLGDAVDTLESRFELVAMASVAAC